MNKTFGEDRTCSYARGETQNRQTDRHGHHNTPPPPIGVGVNNNNLPDSGVGNMSGVRSDRMSKSPSKTLRDRPSFTSARRGHNYLTFVLTRIRAVHKVCRALTHSSWRKTACSVLVSRYIIVRCRRQYCLLSRTCVRRLLYFTRSAHGAVQVVYHCESRVRLKCGKAFDCTDPMMIISPPLVWDLSIMTSVSVCLSVCLSVHMHL